MVRLDEVCTKLFLIWNQINPSRIFFSMNETNKTENSRNDDRNTRSNVSFSLANFLYQRKREEKKHIKENRFRTFP